MAMEECKIGNATIKIYGIAKGSGMIKPNMATTLGYIFTDADLSNDILKKLLKKNINNTFNAISCDGDTSTNDMISIFSTGKTRLFIESEITLLGKRQSKYRDPMAFGTVETKFTAIFIDELEIIPR